MLIQQTVKDFLGKMADGALVPDGGSVSALNGAIAAALTERVARLTIGKEGYEEVEGQMRTIATEADTIREQLLAYVDRESEASLRLDKASALPCGSEEERTEREREIQAATRNAALVALRVAYEVGALRVAYEVGTVMETIIYVAHKGYQPALPEACVAMMSARTCVFAALLRVETYLLSIRDEAFVARTREEVEKLKENTARVERKLADWMSMRI